MFRAIPAAAAAALLLALPAAAEAPKDRTCFRADSINGWTYVDRDTVRITVGVREQYEREKLQKGIEIACYRRPVSVEAREELVDNVEIELIGRELREVPSGLIGDLVMKGLRELDEVAYIRFASVYRSFADLGKLREAVDALMDAPPVP